MDSEKIVELFRNEEFIEKLLKCRTSEEKVDLLSENGIMIGLEEYKRLEEIVKEKRQSALSDEQFENISGGLSSNAKDVLNIISVMEIPVMTESQLQSPFKNN